MQATDPPFGPKAGQKMMETLFLSNWQHEKNGESLSNPARMAGDEVRKRGEMEVKRGEDNNKRRGTPSYKRRRTRAGAMAVGTRNKAEAEL